MATSCPHCFSRVNKLCHTDDVHGINAEHAFWQVDSYLDMAQQMLAPVLGAGSAKVEANAPESNHALFGAILPNWNSPYHLEAFALI